MTLPLNGGNRGEWGTLLLDFLRTAHNEDGSLKDSVIDDIRSGVADPDLSPFFAALDLKADQADLDTAISDLATKASQGALDTAVANIATKANQSSLDTTNATVSIHTASLATHTTQIGYTNPGAAGLVGQYLGASTGGAPVWITEGVMNVKHPRFGAKGDGATDDTAAIQAAITAADKVGGSEYSTAGASIVYFPPGVYLISSLLTFPRWVQVRGSGPRTTAIKATTSAAGLSITGSSGQHGGFFLDGAKTGNVGLYLPVSNGNTFIAIEVRHWNQTGISLNNCQNALFLNANAAKCGDVNLLLDAQAASNAFVRCQFSGYRNTGDLTPVDNVRIQAKTVDDPIYNSFHTCILEGGISRSQLNAMSGDTYFYDTLFVNPGVPVNIIICGPKDILGNAGRVSLDAACRINLGTGQTGVRLNDGGVIRWLTPYGEISGGDVGIDFAHTGGRLFGFPPSISSTTKYLYSGGGSFTTQVRQDINPTIFARQSLVATDQIEYTQVSGVTTFQRYGDGKMVWTADTNLYRSAANVLKTDDKMVAQLGLGVGNSASATTLGTVTKKMEVFDSGGNSLGFVPIYGSIT